MNWRRGFFRLWLVASICWIGWIGTRNVSGIVEEFDRTRFDKEVADSPLLPTECGTVRGSEGKDYVRTPAGASFSLAEAIGNKSYCWLKPASFRSLYPEYADLEVREAQKILFERNKIAFGREGNPWTVLGWTALFSIVPPLLALAIAMILVWIMRGFGRASS